MDERKRRGNRGENLVAYALQKRGCAILERQYRTRFGEIDLVVRTARGILCFVEVKTRTSRSFSEPREAVTPAKQRRLRATAALYLEAHQLDCVCRFDVAEVYPGTGEDWTHPRIHYIANAF